MRKSLIHSARKPDPEATRNWLALDEAASVEVTSEAEGYPIEGALLGGGTRGWQASEPGPQTIRLLFDQPQTIRLIQLLFKEDEFPRTQEFVLRWLPHGTKAWKDVVRQQWNFSPPATASEREEYNVELQAAAALELSINPDISGGGIRATLERLHLSVERNSGH